MIAINYETLAAYSDIILKIYGIQDVKLMIKQFLYSIKFFVEYDGASVYLFNSKDKNYSLLLSEKLNVDKFQNAEDMGIPRELCDVDNCISFRDSDIKKDFGKQIILPKIYEKNRYGYGYHTILKQNGENIGIINLYRTIGNYDFGDENIKLCDIFREHLALRFSREVESLFHIKYTVSEVVAKYGLTPREMQVLKAMLDGKDNYDIGEEMAISIFTIKKHIMNIYRKLDICNRTQLFKMVKEYE